jgi:hypothetical protein
MSGFHQGHRYPRPHRYGSRLFIQGRRSRLSGKREALYQYTLILLFRKHATKGLIVSQNCCHGTIHHGRLHAILTVLEKRTSLY